MKLTFDHIHCVHTDVAEGEADELYFAYVEGPDGVVIEMMEMK